MPADASADLAQPDAGWTACSSPSGYQLCGGPDHCAPDCPLCDSYGSDPDVGFCSYDAATPIPIDGDCPQVLDGGIAFVATEYRHPDGGPNNDSLPCRGVTWEGGQLLYRAGYGSNLIYADGSTFDGTPLPTPSDCPSIPGITLCGGACGDSCAKDGSQVCTGRSPLHPYSFCAPAIQTQVFQCARDDPPGDGKHGCLIYRVSPADQPVANSNGLWIDLATCEAAAAGYPGGADCVTQ